MSKPGPTLNDTKDPQARLRKLVERRQHIKDQIAELEDRKHIIQCEIAAIYMEGRKA